tara:strand:+ start:108 stop:854 length:747 start_codon:yes stop_codon:yes gene_type:complete
MEQRAPRLASAGKIIGILLIIASVVNLKLDLLEKSGISVEEYIGITASILCFIMAYFASKERAIVGLTNNLSLEEQFANLETTLTKSGGIVPTTQSQSGHTKGIIDSILGTKAEVNEELVNEAIGTLSSGDFGQVAQSMAQELPAPHKHAEAVLESPTLTTVGVKSPIRKNIPLPDIQVSSDSVDKLPEIPDLTTTDEHSNEVLTDEIQSLPDLSDLFIDEIVKENDHEIQSSVEFETPELPNIDDLF